LDGNSFEGRKVEPDINSSQSEIWDRVAILDYANAGDIYLDSAKYAQLQEVVARVNAIKSRIDQEQGRTARHIDMGAGILELFKSMENVTNTVAVDPSPAMLARGMSMLQAEGKSYTSALVDLETQNPYFLDEEPDLLVVKSDAATYLNRDRAVRGEGQEFDVVTGVMLMQCIDIQEIQEIFEAIANNSHEGTELILTMPIPKNIETIRRKIPTGDPNYYRYRWVEEDLEAGTEEVTTPFYVHRIQQIIAIADQLGFDLEEYMPVKIPAECVSQIPGACIPSEEELARVNAAPGIGLVRFKKRPSIDQGTKPSVYMVNHALQLTA
jgi:hypothetical protein